MDCAGRNLISIVVMLSESSSGEGHSLVNRNISLA